jgi:succinate dehydrogenase/fumarate reductase flavoprotein subunit
VIDRLARHGIDLTKAAIEVSPIAHYHMGGIAVDTQMASRVPGLYAAGEAAGGANGANRLSGNAIPEALAFGERAGRFAAAHAAQRKRAPRPHDGEAVERIVQAAEGRRGEVSATELLDALRAVMQDDVGPFRDAAGLARAVARLRDMRVQLPELAIPPGRVSNAGLADWFDLRASLVAAEAVAVAALARTESRGAHQRDDFPVTDPAWARNQRVAMAGDGTVMVA